MKLGNALILAGMIASLLLLPCCSTTDDNMPIGNATMDKEGTIHLMLRAESRHRGQDVIGEALLSYPKNHPDYQMIFDHLGGMHSGESKAVPPFSQKGR